MKITGDLPRRSIVVLCAVFTGLVSCRQTGDADQLDHDLRIIDERLTFSVFVEDPEIVTPIGIAADSAGRVFVLESHTHTPPRDYGGPTSDRIKVFVDSDGNGKSDKSWVYADGFHEGVNISFSPSGDLYVVTSRAVDRLLDADRDGISDGRERVLRLVEPEKVYAHAALLGIAFSRDGWMYVSRGNTGGAAWRLLGADGSTVSGYGDGGNIVRARADGSDLHEVATGFWNPVDIKFDSDGRLLAADNDPDSRGPNRLVHVVDGGNYGYRSLYGGGGIHPYLGWNGELPGTLPFAVALGEAPSGLLDATQTALPQDYRGNMLVTIWEESRIVRVAFEAAGTSITGSAEIIAEGREDFRPVAFAHTPDGTVYFTDWVLRKYPNHGRGRIWKISVREREQAPATRSARPDPDRENRGSQNTDVIEALASGDPFVRHTGVMRLSAPDRRLERIAALDHEIASVRIGAMLAMQRAGDTPDIKTMRSLLRDEDEQVRRQALQWIGEAGMTRTGPYLRESLLAGAGSRVLFETYLETVRHLQPAFVDALRSKREPYAKSIARPLPDDFLEHFIQDKTLPARMRAMAIVHLPRDTSHNRLLLSLLSEDQDKEMRMEAVRALAQKRGSEITRALLQIAGGRGDPQLRAEALLSLSWHPDNLSKEVEKLLSDPVADIQLEAARYIRAKNSSAKARDIFALVKTSNPDLKQQFKMAQNSGAQASSAEDTLASSSGDVDRGRRVFYSPLSLCSTCHAFHGRGGDLGPDLSQVARSKNGGQLLQAILDPSSEISPEYQGWFIRLINGEVVQGRQIDVGENSIELYTPSEGFRIFAKDSVADYGLAETSLMPPGLEKNLTASDLRDLLAFLRSQ